jgi:hypothetical protein
MSMLTCVSAGMGRAGSVTRGAASSPVSQQSNSLRRYRMAVDPGTRWHGISFRWYSVDSLKRRKSAASASVITSRPSAEMIDRRLCVFGTSNCLLIDQFIGVAIKESAGVGMKSLSAFFLIDRTAECTGGYYYTPLLCVRSVCTPKTHTCAHNKIMRLRCFSTPSFCLCVR